MKLSLTRVIIFIIIVILSITIGNINTIIRVHLESTNKFTNNASKKDSSHNISQTKVTSSYDDLVWFLQISDIHISVFKDIGRVNDLEEFCKTTIEVVKPSVVLASGDLTDAKNADTLGSRQYEDEWKMYRNTLNKFEVSKKTVWLDVRGNHDNFNVHGPSDKFNYYRNYSMQGGAHRRSYSHIMQSPSGRVVSFIAVDACLEPGPRRPFNFFGLLSERDTEHLKEIVEGAAKNKSQHSVWFSHYPTSCILTKGQAIRQLIASDTSAQAFLCGHLHTMNGLVPQMYTRQQAGFLELELGDWKDNRMYRLAAIDHGLFSFVDVRHNEWPLVLITHPKNALFQIPGREPQQDIVSSTHIRVLAFSTTDIKSVLVKVDGGDWEKCRHVKGPLYVKHWLPELYSNGLHNIKVQVEDVSGRSVTQEHDFSFDGSSRDFKILPRILLMSNLCTIFQVLFGMAIIGCVVPLAFMRIMLARVKLGHKQVPSSSVLFIKRWYLRLWTLANLDSFFYPIVLYPLYITVGPWAVGEVIENHIGVIFIWGIFINGAYLPGSFTYSYGFFQMVTHQFPLTVVLSYKLYRRLEPQRLPSRSRLIRVARLCWSNLPLFLLSLMQLLFLGSFWLSYGTMATVLAPFRLWPLAMTLLLWRRLYSTPLSAIRELYDIYNEASTVQPLAMLKPTLKI